MRAVLQRVSRAKVSVGGETTGEIGEGILAFLGVSREDSEAEAIYILEKILNLRIFEDEKGK
ncbi:MAG TPA: D-aminoacyl-tRNA deacylase, partial [Pyrinomonadaceae bacterium]